MRPTVACALNSCAVLPLFLRSVQIIEEIYVSKVEEVRQFSFVVQSTDTVDKYSQIRICKIIN